MWIAGFLERRQIPRDHVAASLRALDAAAPGVAPDVAGEITSVVAPALAALDAAG